MLTRREFLRKAAAAIALAATQPLFAQGGAIPTTLWLRRGGDELRLDVATPSGYEGVRYLLRDVRAGVMGHPHTALLQLLCWEQAWLAAYGCHAPFVATSGLRLPRTNDVTEGAARGSTHLPDEKGVFRGADLHHPVISTDYFSRLAALATQGGVGIYIAKNFVHHDVGRVRVWRR